MGMSNLSALMDDRVNPIAIKEMRQATKGKFISWTLMIFILIELAIIGLVLLLSKNPGQNFSIGRELFAGLLAVLLLTCLFFLPCYVGIRLASERSGNNVDLFFITTLSPNRIIWGKLFNGIVLTLLFFSAAVPFLTLTYLLRGLDIPSMFLLLGLDFLIVIGCIQFGILLGTLPGGTVSKGLRFLFGLGVLMSVFGMSMQSSFGMLFFGIGSLLTTSSFWWIASLTVGTIVLVTSFFYVISVAVISPESSNRILPIRIYLLSAWLLSLFISWLSFNAMGQIEIMQAWIMVMMLVFAFSMVGAVSERDKWGPRISRKIPKNRFLRLLSFPFFTGAPCGIIFNTVLIALTLLMYTVVTGDITNITFGTMHLSGAKYGVLMASLSLFIFSYTMLGLFVRRMFLNNYNATPIVFATLLLPVLGSSIPVLIGFMLRTDPMQDISPMWLLGNPFVLFYEWGVREAVFIFWGCCAVLIAIIHLPWLIAKFREFKPPEAVAATERGEIEESGE